MFRERLDSNAVKWVQSNGGGSAKKDIYSSILTQRPKPDFITSRRRNDGMGIGFGNGHLSRSIHVNGNDSGSDSDMDISPDSDDRVYVRRYSIKSSPQDGKTAGFPWKETQQRQQVNGVDRLVSGGVGIAEEELSDSATSTEVSFTQFRSSGSYSSNVTSLSNHETAAKQEFDNRGLHNQKLFNADIPSAPPFAGSGSELKHVDQSSTAKVLGTPFLATSSGSATAKKPKSKRSTPSTDFDVSKSSLPARFPTFHASGLGPWCAVISYDACVRLCLHSWARGCKEEAPYFLSNECALLRNAFGLQQVLLQPEEELLTKRSPEFVSEGAARKSKKTCGKMKVEVRKVKLGLDHPPGCSFTSLTPSMVKVESLRQHLSGVNLMLNSGWEAIRRVRVTPHIPANGSLSRQSLAYMHASTKYVKEVSKLLRNGVTTLHKRPSSFEVVQEAYPCLLRLKSMSEEDVVRLQPGSGETHLFLPDSVGDDLIVEVQGSKGECYGRVLVQVAAIADDPSDKLRWWPIYHEPEHELVGRIQLNINYSTSEIENIKCGCVAETVAYDLVLEVAMKAQHFQQRNLLLNGPWKWLLDNFASYYGLSDVYTRLRYLAYVMDVATPTKDCLVLVYEFLLPVIMKRGNNKNLLSRQENRILGEIDDQMQQILALVFENYKSLDELSPSGLKDVFGPATGLAPPALAPAVDLYSLLHDILGSEAQLKLTRHFQAAVKKRSRRHLSDTDEFVLSNTERTSVDPVTLSTTYQKMKSLILSIRNEIFTDIEIHNQHVLPSFIDLPNLSASIYSTELCSRLQSFLVACTPSGPSPPVAELVIATSDFQRDLSCWNINPIKGGVDAKQLFHSYITQWIQDKRLALLDSCKLDKVKWSTVRTQHSTSPFIDDMYDRLREMLSEFEIIICRWPEYAIVLENAVADVERAIVETMDKQYADALSPLKDNLTSKILGLKYVQKIANRNVNSYCVPDELGILLNSMKRMLDVLWPKIESQFTSWSSCIADGGNASIGEHLNEVTVMMRTKFRNYSLAVVEKLVENTRMQNTTKLKKIIQESKETCVESDVRSRMQPLKDLLIKTMDHLHTVVEPHVFIVICRGFWDQMGRDVLHFLENRRENRSWYKSSRIAVSILDDIFASQMQQMLGNTSQEKDLEPPGSILEVRSVLCNDSVNYKNNNNYY